MIPPEVADPIRWVTAALSLVLVVASCYAVRFAEHGDQRVQHAIFGVFAFFLVTGQVAVLGTPSNYRLLILVVVVAAAVWSTIIMVNRERARHRDR